ncbi:uncharacterized protein J8A68_005516 [[Candida] subhashii]|uniref:Signal recognition particle receptor subunit beta n=1 Tax=[Candida] subhashii TaxID=561895 RepID=A0A8J5Q678_9ASCO|nr:uncharacterized protein J8A68_005516 [[Candida] subhashii]KAG7660996.1 hypothetical protein J8A68_005516 [[Candida] subhashii]
MDYIQIALISILLGFGIILVIFFFQSGGIKTIKPSSRSPYYKPTFLILGSNNSGKTSFYFKLLSHNDGNTTKENISTVSSIEPNISEVSLPIANPQIGKKFQLIDYPGHLKYQQLFEKLLLEDITIQNIKGIVYMIDSSSVNFNDQDSVELIVKFLYHLIAITEKKHNGIDFLFAINKIDLFDSLPIHKIKSILETEIDKLIHHEISNVDKTSGIDKAGGIEDDENDDHERDVDGNLREFWLSVIGSPSGKFTFDKLEGNMDFFGGSVLKGKIEPWENWLDEKVVNP